MNIRLAENYLLIEWPEDSFLYSFNDGIPSFLPSPRVVRVQTSERYGSRFVHGGPCAQRLKEVKPSILMMGKQNTNVWLVIDLPPSDESETPQYLIQPPETNAYHLPPPEQSFLYVSEEAVSNFKKVSRRSAKTFGVATSLFS